MKIKKSCPYCGNELDTNNTEELKPRYWLSCMNPECGAECPVRYSLGEAIKAANTRVIDDELVEALRNIIIIVNPDRLMVDEIKQLTKAKAVLAKAKESE